MNIDILGVSELKRIGISEFNSDDHYINIQKTKIMASGPISSWQIGGETMRGFIFLGSQTTADGDCSHEI